MQVKHSIARHPLADEPDFHQIRRDVQYGRISWPVGIEIVQPEEKCDESSRRSEHAHAEDGER